MDNGHILALTGAELDAALKNAQNALPHDGSVAMTGKLYTSATVNGSFGSATDDSALRIDGGTSYDKGAFLTLYGKDAWESGNFQLVAGNDAGRKELRGSPWGGLTWDNNTILHTGNKPSGSYTGNGDAASRTIDVGGVGNVIVLFSGYGVVFVTGGVAHIIRNDGSVLQLTNVSYGAGVLNLSTDDPAINLNSVEYHYQVL